MTKLMEEEIWALEEAGARHIRGRNPTRLTVRISGPVELIDHQSPWGSLPSSGQRASSRRHLR